jgi:hypothetical protein
MAARGGYLDNDGPLSSILGRIPSSTVLVHGFQTSKTVFLMVKAWRGNVIEAKSSSCYPARRGNNQKPGKVHTTFTLLEI